jgi:hypothetical protein
MSPDSENKLATSKFGNLDFSRTSHDGYYKPLYTSVTGDNYRADQLWSPRNAESENERTNRVKTAIKSVYLPNINGKSYVYYPEDLISKGLVLDGGTYLPGNLLKGSNLTDFLKSSEYITLPDNVAQDLGVSGLANKGYLMPSNAQNSSGDFVGDLFTDLVSQRVEASGNITGLTKRGDQYVYATDKPNGYVDSTGAASWYQPSKKSNPLASIAGIGLAIFAPGIGSALGAALGLGTGVAAAVVGNALVQGTMAELSGGDFKDGALKGAIGAGVAPVVANTVGSAVANAMGDSAFNKVVTNAVTSASTAAVSAGLTGNGDIGEAALNAAVASIGGTYGKELGGDTGAKIGTALGKIATGADAEQVLTSTIMDTLKSTVQGALKDSPTKDAPKDGAVKVAEAEADVTVPGADDLQNILDGSAGTQLASTDNDAAMHAIDDLRKPVDDEEDPLLGLSSAEVGQGEIDAITGAGTVDTVEGGVSTDTTGADSVAGGTETAPVTTGPMGPMTEATTKRYSDEFARYLDSLAEGDKPPPNYNVQDLGITDENFKSFDENLKKMLDDGNLPTQWKPGADGTFTFTGDDGDTITINPDGSVVDYTEAPKGNLLSDTLTTAPVTTAPVTTAPVTTAPVTTTPPAAKAADDSSGFNLLSLLALMGGEQKPVQQKPEVNDDPFVAFDFNRPFQVNPFAQNPPTPRMAEGGSIDELLELLQYRGQT